MPFVQSVLESISQFPTPSSAENLKGMTVQRTDGMATQQVTGIVPGDDSKIHDEPH